MRAATWVVDKLGLAIEWMNADAGWGAWQQHGKALPEVTRKAIGFCDCCLVGPVASLPHVLGYTSVFRDLAEWKSLDARLVRCRGCHGIRGEEGWLEPDLAVWIGIAEAHRDGIEFSAIPEELIRLHRGLDKYEGKEGAVSLRILTRENCRRLCERCCRWSEKQGRRKIAAVHRANLLRATDGLFLEEFRGVMRDHPRLAAQETTAPAAAMALLRAPAEHDVLLGIGEAGDWTAALAAQIAGGPALTGVADLGDDFAVFHPMHGSAPDFPRRDSANPIALLRAAGLMLDWLGESAAAQRLEGGIAGALITHKIRTPDLGGAATAIEMAEEIVRKMQ
jgi:isocitrate/isopropylmalate dehydrogenase